MRWPMGPVRLRRAASVPLLAALIGLGFTAPAVGSQTARLTATSCHGLTLSAAFRAVKPGGSVPLSGHACGAEAASPAAGTVSIALRNGRRWKRAGSATLKAGGEFSTCVRVPRKLKSARLRAVGPAGRSAAIRLAVRRKGGSGCNVASTCPLAQPGSSIGMTLPSTCTVVASDIASNPDPIPFWGSIDCQTASRHQFQGSGGDTHPTGTGAPQGNAAFRQLTVIDGDDAWGERCELGLNDYRTSPVALYREGQRRVTFASIYLPVSFPLQTDTWQGVLQMKQSQPAANGDGTPVLSLAAYGGRWRLFHSDSPGLSEGGEHLWTAPARTGAWTRFAFDVTYSQYASVGSIKVYVDLNGDGDFQDAEEASPRFNTYTLKYEIPGGSGIPVGASIPSHLRVGLYHDTAIACPALQGCWVGIDNVQVLRG